MGGRGSSSGGGGRGGSSSGGGGGSINVSNVGVKGVSYKLEEFERSPGHGQAIPLASLSGINAMQSDLKAAGSTTGIVSASADQKSRLVKQLNEMTPEARANNLGKMAAHFLKLKGKKADPANIEKQLNKWGLSGITRMYSPKK